MAFVFPDALRNARADEITTFAGSAALLRIYTAAYATLLVEHVCGTPFAPAASGGVLSLNAIADGTAVASGDAAIARIVKADGTTVVLEDAVVTDIAGAGPIVIAQTGTAISSGQTVVIDATRTITEGNQ
jgi:hypothetical protein